MLVLEPCHAHGVRDQILHAEFELVESAPYGLVLLVVGVGGGAIRHPYQLTIVGVTRPSKQAEGAAKYQGKAGVAEDPVVCRGPHTQCLW